jgi:N utilization substance protein B
VLALYQSDLGGGDPVEALENLEGADAFSAELVRGVAGEREELDRLIGEHAEDWSVKRMAPLDRAILRIAAYELLRREDVPVAAVIDEAVEAAKTLSTERSGSFVNGILGRIAREEVPTDRR